MATTPTDSSSRLAEDSPDPLHAEQLAEEMAAAFRRGEPVRAEAFLARHPGLCEEDAIRLIYEEACLRQEEGEGSITAEILERFPGWRAQLGLLLDCNRLLRPTDADFPEAGDDLGDFRLIAEIGRGAIGRTFLASQHSLARRLMVLKVTPLGQDEHLSLARLQHMNIVPLYLEQVFPDRNLRVLGMPFLGGASLARILSVIECVPVTERTGKTLLEALDHCGTTLGADYPAHGPYRKYLAQASYVQAVCWLGACLADALQYAHDRGLIHLDVKPSNVLIAGDGQPLLLDFHLARAPLSPGDPAPERLGGTPGFLSPEQQAAIDAVRTHGVVEVAVDGRADIYSLGLLLNVALGGQAETAAAIGRPLQHCNPQVSPGLSRIVRKALAHDLTERYADAASLALDLRCHLDDLPLRGVANSSWVERWRKWRRRSPAALARGLVRLALLMTAIAVSAVPFVWRQMRDRQIEAALAEGGELLGRERYAEAAIALRRGLDLAGGGPTAEPGREALNTALRHVLREKTIVELHDVVNMLRFRFGISPPEADEARWLHARGLAIWNARELLVKPRGEPGDPKTERRVQTDLIDLALILADLRAHRATGHREDASRDDVIEILLEAVRAFGPSPALCRDLQSYARAVRRTDIPVVPMPSPRSAWEHYDLGRSYLRSKEYALATEEFRQSIDIQPGEFWPYYFQGICAYRLGRNEAAVAALSTCIALAPKTAECYYNRALAHAALGRDQEAIRDDTRALELSSGFSEAALNRGILLLKAGHHTEALGDFGRARASAAAPARLGLIEYNEALVHIARKDWAAAKACLKQAAAHGDAEASRLADLLERP